MDMDVRVPVCVCLCACVCLCEASCASEGLGSEASERPCCLHQHGLHRLQPAAS